jgi:hypothetical protein
MVQKHTTIVIIFLSSRIFSGVSSKHKDLYGWANCSNSFIWVVKQINKLHLVPIAAIVGLAYLVKENAVSDKINSIWLVHNTLDLDIYWTTCCVKYLNEGMQE